jgi:hypothetical protein
MQLFGYQLVRRDKAEEEKEKRPSFVPPAPDDGSAIVAEGNFYGTFFDLTGQVSSEADLITKYRQMAQYPDVDYAIDDIVNEAITLDEDDVVKVNLDGFEKSSVFSKKAVQDRIHEEFKNILELLDFNNNAYKIFRAWYIDGRIYYHVIIDEKVPEEGIKELRNVDPRKLRKVKEVKRVRDPQNIAVNLVQVKSEYYVFSSTGFGAAPINQNNFQSAMDGAIYGLRIAKDSVVYGHSGLLDENNVMVLSYLHKAIRPLNALKALEDSLVIYRFVRAPERRIFYIDTGSMPRQKAEQYIRDMQAKHKNKLVYDQSNGQIKDDRRFMTMFEDYWLPRREGGKGTEIDTLPGGQNLGELGDVEYFQNKLYRALNIPVSRMNPETSGFTFSKAAEISRDEVKFSRFIDRLRRQFSMILFELLSKQLVLKGVIAKEEIPELYRGAFFEFASDNHFAEVKDNEILSRRIEVAKDIQDFVGKYFSHDYVRTKIFKQTEDDIEQMDEEIEEEKTDERYEPNPMGGNGIMTNDPTFGADAVGGNPMMPAAMPNGTIPGQPQAGAASNQPPATPQQINSSINSSNEEVTNVKET